MAQISNSGLSPEATRLLATMGDDLSRGFVPLWIMGNPEIYQLELDRIFGHNWIYMAHESEIPNNGDFIARTIGEDPFIVARGDDGRVRVLFDSCRHHGARVCPADRGNAATFMCPFHGWTYKNTGELHAVPNRKTSYKTLDDKQSGLVPAPRVENYRGMIFACLDQNVRPLAEHLGDYRWYLDIHLGLAEGGIEVIGEPHRWHIDADWKSGAENFSGDSYHTQTVHQSILRVGLASPLAAGASGGRNDIHVTECNGHSTSIRRMDAGQVFFWGYPEDVRKLFRQGELSEQQFDLARRSISHTGTIFPNLSLIHIGATDEPKKPNACYFSLRQWVPRGPGRMEVVSWVFAPKAASQEYKDRAYKVAVSSFSPSGNFEQDDSIVWSGIARSARGSFAKKHDLKLNYQMGMQPMSDAHLIDDWPGPGEVYDTNLEDGVQRTFFRHWYRAMSGDAVGGKLRKTA
jgi:phenylpropionate dioxygenase-like ring-hydroxylating dioxygenase large terminal subunit